ncbi:MAG: CRISPR-associated endoribonuclease Cas6, partial [Halobacteriaceae archaeon]
HVKLQGVIYRILEKAGQDRIHDLEPFKFLTFSNIFPPENMEEGDSRTLIIASPNGRLIDDIVGAISEMGEIEPGNQRYRVDSVTTFEIDPDRQGRMITGTPIVVRIPEERAREYGIDPGNYDDVYWRLDHNSEAFIDSIEKNLSHKYEEYYNREAPERPYFTGYQPKKQISVPLHYEDRTPKIVGTTWELSYEATSRPMNRVMRLAYAAGVGELNTTGFGFMNKMEN